MSTRGCIAERKGDHWVGVYQHSNSYPTYLGENIFRSIRDDFHGDVQKFIDFAIKEHDAGWSIFPEICYCHGKFAERDGTKPGDEAGVIKGCECNTNNKESSCDPLFIEWVYVLDPKTKKMAVLYNKGEHDDKTCKGDLGGHPHLNCDYTYRHHLATVINLAGEEPDWIVVECGESLERCHHYKWVHEKSICRTCNGNKLVSAGGSRVGYHRCNKDCIPNSKAPIELQNQGDNDTWHVYKPKTGWACKTCNGTGKAQL